ncbi:hypothetical protein OK016_25220 [Vibrio chagasii]|nr:hypothetical protein [Vibrio chagasii]
MIQISRSHRMGWLRGIIYVYYRLALEALMIENIHHAYGLTSTDIGLRLVCASQYKSDINFIII